MCVGIFFLFAFHFIGVVAFSLTVRTLCHLGVGVESHALALTEKRNKKIEIKLFFFMFLGWFYTSLVNFDPFYLSY